MNLKHSRMAPQTRRISPGSGLNVGNRYVLRPPRASCLVWNTPASTSIHIEPL
jgi:hypothetical protein